MLIKLRCHCIVEPWSAKIQEHIALCSADHEARRTARVWLVFYSTHTVYIIIWKPTKSQQQNNNFFLCEISYNLKSASKNTAYYFFSLWAVYWSELVGLLPNAVITIIAIRLLYNYDPTTTYRARLLPFDAIRRERKTNMSIFRRKVVS